MLFFLGSDVSRLTAVQADSRFSFAIPPFTAELHISAFHGSCGVSGDEPCPSLQLAGVFPGSVWSWAGIQIMPLPVDFINPNKFLLQLDIPQSCTHCTKVRISGTFPALQTGYL